jgi:hypothetical protein
MGTRGKHMAPERGKKEDSQGQPSAGRLYLIQNKDFRSAINGIKNLAPDQTAEVVETKE